MYYRVCGNGIAETDRQGFEENFGGIGIFDEEEWSMELKQEEAFSLNQTKEGTFFCKLETHASYLFGMFHIPLKKKKKKNFDFAVYILKDRLIFIEAGSKIKDIILTIQGRLGQEFHILKNQSKEGRSRGYTIGEFLGDFFMELVEEERVESQDSQEGAYERAKELLKKYPDLKGILGSSSFDAPGSAKAIEELGLVGQVFTTGTSTTSSAQKYMESETMKNFTLWDPADSVYAMCDLAVRILEGEEIKSGVDLGIEGYNEMTMDETGKILMGSGWVCVTKDTMADYDF